MVPEMAPEKIPHLLISTTDSGMQVQVSLLDAYKMLNTYLEENSIEKPVVLLSDGHGSRFDDTIMEYLHQEEIILFIGPPDTTNIIQLLDQTN